MKSAFLTGAREFSVRETELRSLGDDEVLVRVVGCGICGSDLHGWSDPELTIVAGDGPLPGFSGHEIVAEPIDAPGSLVVVEPNRLTACGECDVCVGGAAWFCRNRAPLPAFGFSEQMVVPASALFRLPDGADELPATLVEPLACAVHTIRFSHSADDSGRIDGAKVAVLGSGVTGILMVAAARHLGAEEVVVTARHPHQGQAAEQMGAGVALIAGGEETEQALRAYRPDLVVEAVGGRADTLATAIKVVAPKGEVAAFGLFDQPQTLDLRRAAYKELRFFFPITYAVRNGVHDFEIAIEMLTGSDGSLGSLITHEFPLDRINEAFVTASDKRSGALRVVVTP